MIFSSVENIDFIHGQKAEEVRVNPRLTPTPFLKEELTQSPNTLERFLFWIQAMFSLAGGMAIIFGIGRLVEVSGHAQQHNNCDLKAFLFALFVVGIMTFSYVLFPKPRTT
ncbi:MAG: hypothetical protein NUV84_01350 [Candidatus Uhrbacteria bacterium]|nr:hypothetical protein [Candidatus Uhrbacteria bacterium]